MWKMIRRSTLLGEGERNRREGLAIWEGGRGRKRERWSYSDKRGRREGEICSWSYAKEDWVLLTRHFSD